MEIEEPIAGKLWVLVGGVTKKELAAGVDQIGAELPIVGDGVVGIHFEPVLRNARKLIARSHLDVAGGVGKGIVWRAQCESALKRGVDETVIDARLPLVIAIAEAGLDPLAPGIADILEKTDADDVARNAKNFARGIGSEQTSIPLEFTCRLARADAEFATQPGLVGGCDDLLQTRR